MAAPKPCKGADTLTGAYLGGRKQVGMGFKRMVATNTPRLILEGVTEHNLKNIVGRDSAAAPGVRHRRQRLRQVHADPGRAGPRAAAPLRQGHRNAGCRTRGCWVPS